MLKMDKITPKFANMKFPWGKSDRRIHVFATMLGLFSVLCALIVGFVSYKYSIMLTDYQFKNYYLNKVTMILHAAKSQTTDSTDEDFLNQIESFYVSLKDNPPDEYITVMDNDGNILLHTLYPDAAGKNVGNNCLHDIDNKQYIKLKEIIAQNKSFVGDYTSLKGQSQIAAFVPVKPYSMLFGIHRQKSSFKKTIYAGLDLMMAVFIFLCGVLMPASLLILFYKVRLSDKKNKEIERMRRFMEFSIDHATIATLFITADGGIAYANRAACGLFGYSKEEIIDKKITDLNTNYNEDIWKKHFDDIREQKSMVFETQNRDRTGKIIPVEVCANYLLFDGQEFNIAFVQNISERKKKDMEIARIQQLHRAILDNIPDITWLKDTEGRFMAVNEAFSQACGVPVEEIIGKTDMDFFPPDLAKRYMDDDKEIMRLKIRKFVDEPFVNKGGEKKFIATFKTPVFNENGEVFGTTGIARDITDRKRMEQALIFERDYSANIICQTPAIICSLKTDGSINFINPAGEEIIGYKSAELVGKNWWEIFYPQDESNVIENYRKQLIYNDIRDAEMTLCARNGQKKTILWSFIRRFDSSGFITEIIGFGNDITNRIHMEEELFKAKKLDSLSILAGGIAHDFNNFLTTILGNISLARMDADSDILRRAEHGALRAKELSKQLLTFSKGGIPVKKASSIVDLVKETANFILRGSRVKCSFSETGNISHVEIDEGQICQVINNLLINSIQAMPEGGTVNISFENTSLDKSAYPDITQNDFVKITIQDHGKGIPKDHIHKIFDPFFTTKEEGSGLGLSICYSIVKKHNGVIKVESEQNKWTKFEVYLPSSLNTKTDSRQHTAGKIEVKPGAKKKKILIMDDDESIRVLLSTALEKLGYETQTAKDGADLIKKYKQSVLHAQTYDAVIMDLTVPGAMGGKDAMRKLLEIDPNIKAIVSSGYSNDPVISLYEKYGFKSVIPKPYEISEINEVLTKVIG